MIAFASPAFRPDDRTAEAIFAINRAGNWVEFLDAARDFHTPHQNLMFAATDGDIGFMSPGRIPVRVSGDGRAPVPGAEGQHDWESFIPVKMVPKVHNPASGHIINANNRIADEDYPYLITSDWNMTFRATRIVEVLGAQKKHSVADSKALQQDVVSVAARRLLPHLLTVKPSDERGRRAVELLARWDHAMSRAHAEPLIYAVWLRQIVAAIADDELGDALMTDYLALVDSPGTRFVEVALTREQHWCDDIATSAQETCGDRLALALDRALDEISAEQGDDIADWRWGAAHHATFAHRVLTKVPLIRQLADLSIESDGGNHTVNRGKAAGMRPDDPLSHTDGAGYRAVFDLSNLDNSQFMIATGQSGNFLSPHYSDMLRRWRDGEYITIAGSLDQIANMAAGQVGRDIAASQNRALKSGQFRNVRDSSDSGEFFQGCDFGTRDPIQCDLSSEIVCGRLVPSSGLGGCPGGWGRMTISRLGPLITIV